MIKMWGFTCLILISVLFSVHSDCNDGKNCIDCTSISSGINSCRWCPLDKQCHAFGSLKNPCSKSIISPGECYEENSGGIYSETNAYINTLFSAAAYSKNPEECLQKASEDSGFTVVDMIGQSCELFPFDYRECFAYTAISHTKKLIVLAFRGSSSTKQLNDDIVINSSKRKTTFVSGGTVQIYFKTAHEKLYDCIKHSIKILVKLYSYYNVVVTGHSLGGAMASLAAVRLVYENIVTSGQISLFTFGMPRVGDKNYARSHDKLVFQSWRIVHYRDIVSSVPPCTVLNCLSPLDGPYHHGKEVYYPMEQMNMTNNKFKICGINEDVQCSNGAIASKKCINDISTCIQYHKSYFGINFGQHCNKLNGNVLLDADKLRRDSTRFSADRCEIIKVNDATELDDESWITVRTAAAGGSAGGGSVLTIVIYCFCSSGKKEKNKSGVKSDKKVDVYILDIPLTVFKFLEKKNTLLL